MIPLGICTDFVNLPDAHALGYDYVEIPLAGLAALPERDFQEFAAGNASMWRPLRESGGSADTAAKGGNGKMVFAGALLLLLFHGTGKRFTAAPAAIPE